MARAEQVIDLQRQRTQQRLRMSRMVLSGLRVAIFCDLPHTLGMLHVLSDLGCTPVLIGIRGHSLGGESELREAATRTQAPLRDDLPIIDNPSIHRVRTEMERLIKDQEVDVLIGSSTEINTVATLDPEIALYIDHGATWAGSGPKIVEFGFPCRNYHVVRSSPTMGFTGVLGWADRLINAPRLWDTWRTQLT